MKIKLNLLLTTIFLLGLEVNSYSQDLIVPHIGDSLKCKITKETEDKIYFTTKVYGEWRKVFLPKSQIKSVTKSYFKKPEILPEKVYETKYSKFRISADFGISRTLGKIDPLFPDVLKRHLNELKTGNIFCLSTTFFPIKFFGLGFDASRHFSRNEVTGLSYKIPGQTTVRYSNLTEEIAVNYFGPSICIRAYSKNHKTQFNTYYSMGVLNYKNYFYFGNTATITGRSLGIVIGESVDFKIDRNILLGIGAKITLGALTKARITTAGSSEVLNLSKTPESLSRIEITAGLKINSIFR